MAMRRSRLQVRPNIGRTPRDLSSVKKEDPKAFLKSKEVILQSPLENEQVICTENFSALPAISNQDVPKNKEQSIKMETFPKGEVNSEDIKSRSNIAKIKDEQKENRLDEAQKNVDSYQKSKMQPVLELSRKLGTDQSKFVEIDGLESNTVKNLKINCEDLATNTTNIEDKSIADVDKTKGIPQNELGNRVVEIINNDAKSGEKQKEYSFDGQKISVYFQSTKPSPPRACFQKSHSNFKIHESGGINSMGTEEDKNKDELNKSKSIPETEISNTEFRIGSNEEEKNNEQKINKLKEPGCALSNQNTKVLYRTHFQRSKPKIKIRNSCSANTTGAKEIKNEKESNGSTSNLEKKVSNEEIKIRNNDTERDEQEKNILEKQTVVSNQCSKPILSRDCFQESKPNLNIVMVASTNTISATENEKEPKKVTSNAEIEIISKGIEIKCNDVERDDEKKNSLQKQENAESNQSSKPLLSRARFRKRQPNLQIRNNCARNTTGTKEIKNEKESNKNISNTEIQISGEEIKIVSNVVQREHQENNDLEKQKRVESEIISKPILSGSHFKQPHLNLSFEGGLLNAKETDGNKDTESNKSTNIHEIEISNNEMEISSNVESDEEEEINRCEKQKSAKSNQSSISLLSKARFKNSQRNLKIHEGKAANITGTVENKDQESVRNTNIHKKEVSNKKTEIKSSDAEKDDDQNENRLEERENAESNQSTKPLCRARIRKPQPIIKIRQAKKLDRFEAAAAKSSDDHVESRVDIHTSHMTPISDISSNAPIASASVDSTNDAAIETQSLPPSPIKQAKKSQFRGENKEIQKRRYVKGQNPPERSKMTMLDLIYWNPAENRMKCSTENNKTPKVNEEKQAEVINTEKPANLEENVDDPAADDTATDDTNMPGPRLIVGPNGEITIDENSLVIRRTLPENNSATSEVAYEDNATTYSSFRPPRVKRGWCNKETAQFYRALSVVGTDFTLMSNLLPKRSRHELKLKFKREERHNSRLIDKVLNDPQLFDISMFQEESLDEALEENLTPEKKPKPKKKRVPRTEKAKATQPRKRKTKKKGIPRTYCDDSDSTEISEEPVLTDTQQKKTGPKDAEKEHELLAQNAECEEMISNNDNSNQNEGDVLSMDDYASNPESVMVYSDSGEVIPLEVIYQPSCDTVQSSDLNEIVENFSVQETVEITSEEAENISVKKKRGRKRKNLVGENILSKCSKRPKNSKINTVLPHTSQENSTVGDRITSVETAGPLNTVEHENSTIEHPTTKLNRFSTNVRKRTLNGTQIAAKSVPTLNCQETEDILSVTKSSNNKKQKVVITEADINENSNIEIFDSNDSTLNSVVVTTTNPNKKDVQKSAKVQKLEDLLLCSPKEKYTLPSSAYYTPSHYFVPKDLHLKKTPINPRTYSRKRVIDDKQGLLSPMVSSVQTATFTPDRSLSENNSFTTTSASTNQCFAIPITPKSESTNEEKPTTPEPLMLFASNPGEENVVHVFMYKNPTVPPTFINGIVPQVVMSSDGNTSTLVAQPLNNVGSPFSQLQFTSPPIALNKFTQPILNVCSPSLSNNDLCSNLSDSLQLTNGTTNQGNSLNVSHGEKILTNDNVMPQKNHKLTLPHGIVRLPNVANS